MGEGGILTHTRRGYSQAAFLKVKSLPILAKLWVRSPQDAIVSFRMADSIVARLEICWGSLSSAVVVRGQNLRLYRHYRLSMTRRGMWISPNHNCLCPK